MEWNIYKANRNRKKWSIRGELWNGLFIKLPGHRDRKVAEQIMRNIESLNNSKRFNEPPDSRLADWIAGLPEDDAKRYVQIGLLDARYFDARRSLNDLIVEYHEHLKTNNRDASIEPSVKLMKLRRIIGAMKVGITFDQLTIDGIVKAVKDMDVMSGRRKSQRLSQKSVREYMLAMKSFCKWMVNNGKAPVSPMAGFKASSAKSDPVCKRRPMSLEDFTKLVAYVRRAPLKAKNGAMVRWKPQDRVMTYRMTVATAFRAKELKSLTPTSIDFGRDPATVTVEAYSL